MAGRGTFGVLIAVHFKWSQILPSHFLGSPGEAIRLFWNIRVFPVSI